MKHRHVGAPRRILWVLTIACGLWAGLWPALPSTQASTAAQPNTGATMLFSSAPDAPDSDLQKIVEETVGDLPGTWGVAIKKLDTGQYAAFNGDKQQVSASLYKMWALDELFRQVKASMVSLDDQEMVTGNDTYEDSLGGGARLSPGDVISLSRAAYLMITVSDNTCAHLLVRVLDPDNVNRFMRQNGLSHSVLDWYGGGDNLTTPLDMLREMELIATSQMVDAGSSRQMIDLLAQQQENNVIPPGLPDGVVFAHKTGWLDGLLHDAGIVYGPSGPFVIVVMASDLYSYQQVYDNVPTLAARVYTYFNSRPANPARFFPETRQVVGHDFLKFWQSYGGLDNFGYPIGPEQMRDGKLIQEFEKARFEWHPENASAGGLYPSVTLGPVGTESVSRLGLRWPISPNNGEGKYFTQTGRQITGAFYEYWLNHGGERLFGLPISPAANMVNRSDGKIYYTQWFERARLELHTELPVGSQVVVGALGRELSTAIQP